MVNSRPALKLILASASPRRRELLGHLKLPFEVLTQNVEEVSEHSDPAEFSREIAEQKGKAVIKALRLQGRTGHFVVSADTVVSLAGRIYGKPRDRAEAREFLQELAGKTHSVFTAVSLALEHAGELRTHSFVEEARVSFSAISPELMERYLDTGDSLDKAGAYGIQGPSLTFVDRVEGSYSNVVGFPLSRFVSEAGRFLTQTFPEVKSWFELF